MIQKNKDYFFINIVDNDTRKIACFSKTIEEKYPQDILTGLNFAKTKDHNFLLSCVFKSKDAWENTLIYANSFGFSKVYLEEENWIELMFITDVCILGNFTYKMLLENNTKEVEKNGLV